MKKETNLWFERRRKWQEDCLKEWNERFGDNRKFYDWNDFELSDETDPGTLVEFASDGTAYPHGIGGVTSVQNAVTPWFKSKYFIP